MLKFAVENFNDSLSEVWFNTHLESILIESSHEKQGFSLHKKLNRGTEQRIS